MMESKFHSHIDTIQTKEPLDNREIQDVSTRGATSYTKGNNIITKYNPNNCSSTYKINGSVTETEEILNNLMTALTVIDVHSVNYSRVDVATDISVPFNSISKLLYLIHRCIGVATKYKDGKYKKITDMITEQCESYVFKSNMIEIEFYDKYKQALAKKMSLEYPSKYPTRLEIRFLRRETKDLKLHVNKAIELWKSISLILDNAESLIIDELKEIYTNELYDGKIANFYDFVCRYQDKFTTRNIMEQLYIYSEMKGSFKKWLEMYRQNHVLIFYNKTEINKFIKDVVKSLKNYIKK